MQWQGSKFPHRFLKCEHYSLPALQIGQKFTAANLRSPPVIEFAAGALTKLHFSDVCGKAGAMSAFN
jgi:hypothetical protein